MTSLPDYKQRKPESDKSRTWSWSFSMQSFEDSSAVHVRESRERERGGGFPSGQITSSYSTSPATLWSEEAVTFLTVRRYISWFPTAVVSKSLIRGRCPLPRRVSICTISSASYQLLPLADLPSCSGLVLRGAKFSTGGILVTSSPSVLNTITRF